MRKAVVAVALLALAGCGHSGAIRRVAPSPSPSVVPAAYGISRPFDDCTVSGAAFGPGWKVFGWNRLSGTPEALDWNTDVAEFIRETAGTPLGFDPAWYCPPRGR